MDVETLNGSHSARLSVPKCYWAIYEHYCLAIVSNINNINSVFLLVLQGC